MVNQGLPGVKAPSEFKKLLDFSFQFAFYKLVNQCKNLILTLLVAIIPISKNPE